MEGSVVNYVDYGTVGPNTHKRGRREGEGNTDSEEEWGGFYADTVDKNEDYDDCGGCREDSPKDDGHEDQEDGEDIEDDKDHQDYGEPGGNQPR